MSGIYLVTGGAGFIGSNIVRELNERGERVIVVDRITEAKVKNVAGLRLQDFIEVEDFYKNIESNLLFVKGVFHQGACSDTTHPDPAHVMSANYKSTRKLLDVARERCVRFVYASSAAVYGNGGGPLNVYGYSKKLIDDYVFEWHRQFAVGLRYFNVYGPGESHKGKMASLAFKMNDAIGRCRRFEAFLPETRRDFVHVSDVVKVNMHFMFDTQKTGVFDVGSGHARTIRELAEIVGVELSVGAFPEDLRGKYQDYTCADLSDLRDAGYNEPMLSLEQGVKIGW